MEVTVKYVYLVVVPYQRNNVLIFSVRTPRDCQFNFAVPSEKTIQNHASKYRLCAASPGILQNSLDSFATAKPASDCKLSIDGKKIAYGFGKHLGDEDLCGHEDSPTLKERKDIFEAEMKVIASLRSELMTSALSISTVDKLPER